MAGRFWAYAELDEDTHRALMALVTTLGSSPLKVVEELIVEGLEHRAMQEEGYSPVPVDLQVWAGLMKVRRVSRIRAQLTQIAVEHRLNPSEESAELLERLCTVAGVPIEDVVLDATHDDNMVPLVQDRGNGVESCVRWMRAMIKPNQEYSATWVMNEAQQMGFSPYVTKAAKGRLGIKSHHRSDGWIWMLHEENETISPITVTTSISV